MCFKFIDCIGFYEGEESVKMFVCAHHKNTPDPNQVCSCWNENLQPHGLLCWNEHMALYWISLTPLHYHHQMVNTGLQVLQGQIT